MAVFELSYIVIDWLSSLYKGQGWDIFFSHYLKKADC
jgi:hypothetical protein